MVHVILIANRDNINPENNHATLVKQEKRKRPLPVLALHPLKTETWDQNEPETASFVWE